MSKKNTKNTYYEELKQEILAFFSINGEHTFELNHLHQHYDLRDKQKKCSIICWLRSWSKKVGYFK
jgi:hypothetical protein